MTDRTKGTLQILAWITVLIIGGICGFMIGWSSPAPTQDEPDKKPVEEVSDTITKEVFDITVKEIPADEKIHNKNLGIPEMKIEEKIEPIFLGTFTCTAYCPCEKCCGKWARNRPLDENGNPIVYTASGAIAKPNHTIAVDPSVIPYGTKVIIDGITYTAEDCGGGVKKNRIDIYFDSHEDALWFGRQQKDVYLG